MYQCRRSKRRRLDPWIRKIPWSRNWQPAPVFLPGKLHGQEPGRLKSMGFQSQTQLGNQHTHTHSLWHYNMLQIYLEFPCFRPVISHFSEELSFLCWRITIWALSGLSAPGCHCFPLSQQTELVGTCTHTDPSTHIYNCFSIYPSVSVVCQ